VKAFSRRILLATFSAAALSIGDAALAQPYPNKPITIVVPFPAGAGMDVVARALGEKLAKRVGQPVLVENRSGASGTIGNRYVAQSPKDGYTLLFASTSLSFAQMVLKTSPANGYDALNDFAPIIEIGRTPVFLVTNSASGFKSFKEVLVVNLDHVPYKGSAPAVTDLAGGHIPFAYVALSTVKPYMASGRLIPLAVASGERSKLAPEIPTLNEYGYKGIDYDTWYGLFGPRGMPAEAIKLLNSHLNEILVLPEIVKVLADQGTSVTGGTPESLGKANQTDSERWGKVIKETGIQAD
jgi:tripartite-type tricarboxylate transporter receptor subunit TctC